MTGAGRPVDRGEVHPLLHEWQAAGVAWAVERGRAAMFWDCGLRPMWVGESVAHAEAEIHLPDLFRAIREVPLAGPRRARLLLPGMLWRREAQRIDACLRAVRRVVLPTLRGAGFGREGAAVLFGCLLRRVAAGSSRRHVSQVRQRASASDGGGICSRAAATPRRGRPPHRQGQVERRPVEPRGLSISGSPRALSLWKDDR